MGLIGKTIQALRNLNNSKGAHDLTGWIAHGGSELANFSVHGHAAPIYAHNAAPPDQDNQSQETDAGKHNAFATSRDAQHKLERASQDMQARIIKEPEPPEHGMSR